MGLTSTLNTSLAGLQVTQQVLQIVGSNVANAQTAGYVRKVQTQVAVAAGNTIGVRTASIERSLDTIVQAQLRQETSGGAYANKLDALYQQLQAIYGAPGSASGIDTLFGGFTSAIQTLANSPNSSAAQSNAVNAAKLLAQQLNSVSASIQTLRTSAEQGIAADVLQANNALQQIAKINQQIATSGPLDPTTATLLDQRDGYIDQLAQLMDINVIKGDFNQVQVFTGSGYQLVGMQAVTLSFDNHGTLTPASRYDVDPAKRTVGTITMTNPNGGAIDLVAAGAIKSGEIAAYLQMRDQLLPQAQAQLDEFAAQMSQSLSDVTTAGTPVTVGAQSGFAVDTSALQNGNVIDLSYTDAAGSHSVRIVRVDDPSVLPLSGPGVIGVDFSGGMASVVAQLNSALGPAVQFANPGGNLLQAVNGPAVTVDAMSQTTTVTSLTSGNAQLSLFLDGQNPYTGAITATGDEKVGFAQRITVNAALVINPSGLVNYTPTTPAGDSTRPDFIYQQMAAASLTYSSATGLGSSSAPLKGTLTMYLGQVMTQQGLNAANASALQEGQQVVVNSLQQRMDTTSGVDIDTEMAHLLVLQNAYAANARVFSTVQQMFQSLMDM